MLWSAADIFCLTIELKLLETIAHRCARGGPLGPRRDDFARGLPAVDRGLGALVAGQAGLDHHADGDDRLFLDLRRCGALMAGGPISWRPSPDLMHPNIFLAGLLLTGYVVAAPGQADPGTEPLLRTPSRDLSSIEGRRSYWDRRPA